MQLWFWSAVLGGVLAGISNFCFKVAAERGYDAELFTLYSGLTGLIVSTCLFPLLAPEEIKIDFLVTVTFIASFLAVSTGMMKVHVLRHIDTTIYYPLFKLFGPLIAVVWGVSFLGERFSYLEWLGIFLGLTVPLLLITKIEYHRQNNLTLGIVLMLVTAVTSAMTGILNKYVIDQGMSEWETMWYMGWGIFVGVTIWMLFRYGFKTIVQQVTTHSSRGLILWSSVRSALITFSMFFIFYAYGNGGTLGVVQTINSMYILIPIVLAIYFYKEHWNAQKMLAVVLSVVALAFFH
jgi:drug/metabolite transporter (DMT)-like permease